MDKRVVAVFDFDGTITTCDTFIAFIRYVFGARRLWLGFLLHSVFLVGYLLRLYPNYKLKQRIFSHFFRGMEQARFRDLGTQFQTVIDAHVRPSVSQELQKHISQQHQVYVVSASIFEWVAPWCCQHGVSQVIATEAETDAHGRLTGRFSSRNCYGLEKVNRLLRVEPHRETYRLIAYGDSRGDREMLAFADEGIRISGNS